MHCCEDHEHTDAYHAYNFHSFRYAFAQYNIDHLTRDQVQEQMGHRSPNTTDGYIDYAKRQRQFAIDVHVPSPLRVVG